MCGIIGYLGNRNASMVIPLALEKAETRGYHGFGVAVFLPDGSIEIRKKGGEDSLIPFQELLKENPLPSSKMAIGHNRWATQGKPCDKNTHPHYSTDETLMIVHNGVIENTLVLVEQMKRHDFPTSFVSETDTEILASWIAFVKKRSGLSSKEVIKIALSEVAGTYAIICVFLNEPGVLYSAVCGRALRLGIGNYENKPEYFISSEIYPFAEYTQDYIIVPHNCLVTISKDGDYTIETFDGVKENPEIKKIDFEIKSVGRGDYSHWMLKEIFEQPGVLKDVMAGRVSQERFEIKLSGILEYEKQIANAKRIFVVAHGTSFYSARVFKYMFEAYTGILVDVELASEFSYRRNVVGKGDIVIGVSQSGETADTIKALEVAESQGAIILGICNVPGSHIAEMTKAGSFLRAGRELGVASTKAFTSQVCVFAMLTLHLAYVKNSITKEEYNRLKDALIVLPAYVDKVLLCEERVKELADKYSYAESMYYLGRGANFPIALEGALKLKEIAGIHAEGYSASEMKHGPIGLIGPNMPVIFIATESDTFEKSIANIKEALARHAPVIAIVSEGSNYKELENNPSIDLVVVPRVLEFFSPIINVIPLQLFAYHMALIKNKNPDKPEGLAKSVTVE